VHLVGEREAVAVVSVQDVSSWALADGQPPSDYRVRSTPGGSTQLVGVGQALSLRSFIEHVASSSPSFAGLEPADLGIVKIPRPSIGYVSTLIGSNLKPAGSNGFIDSQVPVLYAPGGDDTVAYARPLTADPNDVNQFDFFQSDGNGALEITLSTTGTVLHPTISYAPTSPDAKQSVRFTVDVPGAPDGATFLWKFGGGGDSAKVSPTHSWAAAANWGVSVSVEAPDNSYGQTTTVVAVGDPPPPTDTKTPPTDPGGGGGPGPGGGLTPGRGPSGVATPASTPTSGITISPEGAGEGVGASLVPHDASSSARVPENTAVRGAGRDERRSDTVTGILLTDGDVAGSNGATLPTAGTSTVVPATDGLHLSSAVWISAAFLLLLLAGALSELREWRPTVRDARQSRHGGNRRTTQPDER
jgi:hypothetical protein